MASPIIILDTLDSLALENIKQSLLESVSLTLLSKGKPIHLGICSVVRRVGTGAVELQVSTRKPALLLAIKQTCMSE